ncbi:MAG: hypothetical protein WCR72_10110 [Bacteroidota bacterium]
MNYKLLEVESRLFNRNIIQLGPETSAGEYAQNETTLITDKNPYYTQHQLNASDLTGIHAFEDLGFRFIEFRIFRHLEHIDPSVSSRYSFPFVCELISNKAANKKAILAIAAQHSSDDRFTRDPLISNDLAKKRLELYILKSLCSYPKQFVYGLFNQQSEQLIGFRTGIFAEPGLVKYFYYFMQKHYNDPKYIAMLETGIIEDLLKRKVNRIEAVSSGLNVQEMNDSSLLQGFVVDSTMVLLRKIF